MKTEIPGPRSRAVLGRRSSALPTGLGRATDVVVERAEGALVHDADGNTFIDFVGDIGALAVGHCPPAVLNAMHDEALLGPRAREQLVGEPHRAIDRTLERFERLAHCARVRFLLRDFGLRLENRKRRT